MSGAAKFSIRLGVLLLVVFLLIWRPRIAWPTGTNHVAYVVVRLPRSLARLQKGIHLQILGGSTAYYLAPKNILQSWTASQRLGKVCVEGIELRDRAFHELCVGRRESSSGHWCGLASVELFPAGNDQLLLFWGSRACRLEIPHGARYVATRVHTQLLHLREFLIRPHTVDPKGEKSKAARATNN